MSVRVATRSTPRALVAAAWRRVPVGPLALYSAVGAVVIFLAMPIVVLIWLSFTSIEFITFPPVGFSLKWYARMWALPGLVGSLVLSLQLAAQAAALSIVLGVAAALGLARSTFPGRSAVLAGIMSPLVVPSIVTGLAVLQFFYSTKMRSADWNLIVGHVVITLPYIVRTVLASLEVFDWSLVETARVLGAGHARAFWRITLPIIRPGVLAGGIFAFLMSFDNFTVSMFLGDGEWVPLPVRIFTYVQYILDPGVAALSTMLIAGSTVILIASDRMVGAGRLRGI